MQDIENIKKEYDEILQQFSDPELISNWPASNASRSDAGWDKFEEIQKRKNHLEKIIEKDKEIQETKNRIEENKLIIAAKEEPELVTLAETEINLLSEKVKILGKELDNLISQPAQEEKTESRPESAIIEIREGTGGEEAGLFAADLFNMYSKYAQSQSWRQTILDSHPTDLGGIKEIIFELKNGNVFSKMKYEGGVHRVQRIPETEKSGRVHTSTATVAILPKPKTAQLKINPNDLKIDFYNASGPGGQNVNKRKTAVRLTYLPTGLAVTSQASRNQQENKEFALSILEARLLEQKQTAEEEKTSGKRRSQIGGAKRAEKIRTYNFPQDRVTDHRIKKNFHNIEGIMEGKLEPIIEALQKAER